MQLPANGPDTNGPRRYKRFPLQKQVAAALIVSCRTAPVLPRRPDMLVDATIIPL